MDTTDATLTNAHPTPVENQRPHRKAWTRLVALILTRDHHTCQIRYPGICTTTATTADHITPISRGGTNHPTNLQAACTPCNQHKNNNPNPTPPPSRPWL